LVGRKMICVLDKQTHLGDQWSKRGAKSFAAPQLNR
jgi:hypothetical protein